MKRSEYLETPIGQEAEYSKRCARLRLISLLQEPKSKKSITDSEKRAFRREVVRQLKERGMRAQTGNIVLRIDFFVTNNNPPALHTLTKNYLDLLHKPDPKIDNLQWILFKDDSQIKILIANYYLRHSKPEIRIASYRFSDFIKDIELVYNIMSSDYDHKLDESEEAIDSADVFDLRIKLRELERHKEDYIKMGDGLYEFQKLYLLRAIQEKYLIRNDFRIKDLIPFFWHSFYSSRKWSSDKHQSAQWDKTREYIFLTADFFKLGKAPTVEGETKDFKRKLEHQLKNFRLKHNVLFPLLQPIGVTVIFIPPKVRVVDVVDLDNLARYIVPFVNTVLEPPPTLERAFKYKSLNKPLKNEAAERIPPNCITGYQIICVPRKDSDPVGGRIEFVLTEGFNHKTNVWLQVNTIIDKWRNQV